MTTTPATAHLLALADSLRQSEQISISALARSSGLSRSYLHRLLRQRQGDPTLRTYDRIMSALGMKPMSIKVAPATKDKSGISVKFVGMKFNCEGCDQPVRPSRVHHAR